RNFYNIIYEETHRLSQLIDNLLNLSMLETGAANIHIAPTRLKKLLQDCVDVVLPQCESHSIRLVADLPDRLPTLDLDKSLFTVAIMNILGNAVKYTPDGGTVTLFTVSKEDDFLIIIQDNGIGIPDTYLPRIFEKFFRCPAGEDQKRPGSGVGLATAMQIVRIHGGNIGVQSKIGEGTQFTILLPRSLINSSVGD
ncbi:HAMP domain-containing histidine kinase, partial [bacterium]|nr:HAMP domain-containing histidine kinase [bacterium]